MKQGKRPTRRQKSEIKAAGLIPVNWLIEDKLIVINRLFVKTRDIRRWA
ncbi:DUF6906 family protein [Paenibacillus monticola]